MKLGSSWPPAQTQFFFSFWPFLLYLTCILHYLHWTLPNKCQYNNSFLKLFPMEHITRHHLSVRGIKLVAAWEASWLPGLYWLFKSEKKKTLTLKQLEKRMHFLGALILLMSSLFSSYLINLFSWTSSARLQTWLQGPPLATFLCCLSLLAD